MTKELSEREKAFLDALGGSAKGDFNKAKIAAGYSPNTTITSITNQLRDEIIEVATNILVRNASKAAFAFGDVLDGQSGLMARDKISAAEKILDRVGIVKKDQVHVTSNGPAIVILPPKGDDEFSF